MNDEQEYELFEHFWELYEEAYAFTCRAYNLPNEEEGVGNIVRVHNWNQEQLEQWFKERWLPHMQNLIRLRREFADE